HLVGAGVEDRLGVGDRPDPAADRERDEHVVGRAPRELDDRVALLVRCRDVQEDELVGAFGVVALGELHRVAGVAVVDEVRALDHAAGVDVEAGDHALEVHQSGTASGSSAACPSATVNRPSYKALPTITPPRFTWRSDASARRSSSAPMPPEYSQRPRTVSAMRRTSSRSGPSSIPSLSTLV